ncbi:MAG: amidohydrolase family protein, partial [Bacteroidota bacterium]
MKNTILSLLVFFFLLSISSCGPSKIKADLIVTNGLIYTVDSAFANCEAFAVIDGKIAETGSNHTILTKYTSEKILDVENKIIFPGFIDAHCHFYNYGLGLQEVNLVGTSSFDEVLNKLSSFAKTHPKRDDLSRENWIIGRGWDQNDWDKKQFPDRKKLDLMFPDRPVLLTRIDGHAALANACALKLAGINSTILLQGGSIENTIDKNDTVNWNFNPLSIESKNINRPGWSPTGILID